MSMMRHPKQTVWMQLYKDRTGFDAAIKLNDLEDGSISFAEFAKANIKWYEAHSQDAYLAISRSIPCAH